MEGLKLGDMRALLAAICLLVHATVTDAQTRPLFFSCEKADVGVILDSSFSINQGQENLPMDQRNWAKVLRYVQNVVTTSLTIAPNRHQFSMINYGNKAFLNFTFNQYQTNDQVLRAIADVPYKDQNTNTSGALWIALRDMFVPKHGDRPDAVNIALIITDGYGNIDENFVNAYATELKKTTEVFVIGITNLINDTELNMIASLPTTFYKQDVVGFDELGNHVNHINGAQCTGGTIGRTACFSAPCLNGGICVSTSASFYQCTCSDGYQGVQCQQAIPGNPCTSNPCMGGGSCYASVNTPYTCACPSYRAGLRCELGSGGSACTSFPCVNNGVCASSLFGYVCACPPGYNGLRCELAPNGSTSCLSSPCRNNGVCVGNQFGYFCSCPAGYTGPQCESSPACSSNPCRNGGVCWQNACGYMCACPSGFNGPNC